MRRSKKEELKAANEYTGNGNKMRRAIFSDREYIRYLDEEWGIDIFGRAAT